MKVDSVTVEAASLDALTGALRAKYSECSEIPSRSRDMKLLVIEKYYFRTNSNALGVVLIESMENGMYLVNIAAGGGREGWIGLDWGAESQFVNEVKKTILKAEEEGKGGTTKSRYDTTSFKSERCVVCNQPVERGDTLVKCPSCGAIAHKTHMLEWLHTRDYCPSCHVRVNESTLKPSK